MKGFSLLVIISLCFHFTSFSQIFDPSFDRVAEMNRLSNVPNSPEAQAFKKYGETPINMYNGTPTINIPLYTHSGKEMSLPMSLDYDASGIKVNQFASQVGLGWNLNVGGRISRITNGMPDDYHTGIEGTIDVYNTILHSGTRTKIMQYMDTKKTNDFDDDTDLKAYMQFLKDLYENKIDAQPDLFSLNALGVNEVMVIDYESSPIKAVALNNPRIKVVFDGGISPSSPISKWTVTLEDGTHLEFSDPEITFSRNLDDQSNQGLNGRRKKFNSSWQLTKIISPTDKDTYTFTYTDLPIWDEMQLGGRYTGVVNVLTNPTTNPNWNSPTQPMGYNGGSEYKILQKALTGIDYNNQPLVDFILGDRCDIVRKKIDRMEIYNEANSGTAVLLKAYDFDYSYFKTDINIDPCDPNEPTPNVEKHVRLKLNAVDIKDQNDNYIASYYAEYNKPFELPVLYSYSQDYYGFYNGRSNTDLYPSYPDPIISTGANRSPNFTTAVKGTISKLIYPTGGYTEFHYEGNTASVHDYNSTVWNLWTTLTNSQVNTSNLDPSACNVYEVNGGNLTERTPTLESFNFTMTNPGSKAFAFSRSGSTSANYLYSEIQLYAGLAKIDPSNTSTLPLQWNEIRDEFCQVSGNIEYILPMPEDDGTIVLDLEAGDYQLFIANFLPGITQEVSIYDPNNVPVYEVLSRAGLRIKKIQDYADQNTLQKTRTYEYDLGTEISKPEYAFFSNQLAVDDGGVIISTPVMYRYSSASGTDKPHIGYGAVTERVVNQSNQAENGYTIYKFNKGDNLSGIFNYHIQQQATPNFYGLKYVQGKPSEVEIYDDSDILKRKSTSEYANMNYFLGKGLYTVNNENNNHQYPVIETVPNSNPLKVRAVLASYTPIPSYAGGGGGFGMHYFAGGIGSVGLQKPSECDSWGAQDGLYCTPAMARVATQQVRFTGSVGAKVVEVSSEFFGSAEKKETTYYDFYDTNSFENTRSPQTITHDALDNLPPDLSPTNYLLKRTVLEDSEGNFYNKEFFYPENFSSTIQYQHLRTGMIYNALVQNNLYKNNNKLSSKKTNFDESHRQPTSMETAKGLDALESRVVFEAYTDGNLTQAKGEDGQPVAYLWGYGHRYVVAKIENAQFNTVVQNLSVNSYAALQSLDSQGLASEFASLRSSMPNHLITTYTYEPGVGVSSITDPSGLVTNYEHDDFQRLKYVKDADDNILKEIGYNYRDTPAPTDPSPPPPIMEGGTIVYSYDMNLGNNIIEYTGSVEGVTGGVGSYSYAWTYSVDGATPISMGTDEVFTYQYTVDLNSGPCEDYDITDPNNQAKQIVFSCVVSDSDSPSQSLPAITKTVTAICVVNQQ